MTNRRFSGVVIGIILFAAAYVNGAEKETQNDVTLEEIVVTATKTEKLLKDVPGSVSLIEMEDIQKQKIQTVDEVLNNLSGVFVKRTKGLMDTTASVRMRGFNGDEYTLVLLDGHPLNDAYTGGLDWSSLSLGNIERMEVMRGAASALYGRNAMGGVINIITRTPESLELETSGSYGTNNTRRYRFSIGDCFMDKWSVLIGYEQHSTDGYATTPVVRSISSGEGNTLGGYLMKDEHGDPTRWVVGDKGENSADRRSFSGKLSLDFSGTGRISLTAVSGKNEYDYGPPHTYMGTFGDNSTYAVVGEDQRALF